MVDLIFEITPDGDVECLWTDEIDLFDVGQITNVRKASNVDFNESEQMWEVSSLDGEVLHQNKNRELAIDWEIVNFSPGGKHYAQSAL